MTLPAPLAAWHHVVQSRDLAALGRLLADDVVFHSPVVHTPQRGKEITFQYLAGAMQVLNTPQFRYERRDRPAPAMRCSSSAPRSTASRSTAST